jgi:hypothetical protein
MTNSKNNRRSLFACGVELVLENGKVTIPGKSNDGPLRQEYADKLALMTEAEFLEACKKYIWLSAYANNNPRSDYHWMADACSLEAWRRDREDIYNAAYNEVSKQ